MKGERIMLQGEGMTTGQAIVEGTASAILLSFVQNTFYSLIPYMIVIVATVTLDLYEGVRASKKRGEEVRVSRAIRRTVSKLFEYCCWIVFAGSLMTATGSSWLFYVVLVIPFVTELYSIITNHLFARGKKITGLNLWKILGGKIGVDLDDVKVEPIEEEKTSDQ